MPIVVPRQSQHRRRLWSCPAGQTCLTTPTRGTQVHRASATRLTRRFGQYGSRDPLRPRDHRQRIATRSLTSASRSTGSRSSRRAPAAPASTSGASRPRCSCTRPTWPPPSRTPASWASTSRSRACWPRSATGSSAGSTRSRWPAQLPCRAAGERHAVRGTRRFTGPRTIDTGTGRRSPPTRSCSRPAAEPSYPTSPGSPRSTTTPATRSCASTPCPSGSRSSAAGSWRRSSPTSSARSAPRYDPQPVRRAAARRGRGGLGYSPLALARERWDVRLDTTAEKVEEYDGGIRLHLDTDGVETPSTSTWCSSPRTPLQLRRAGPRPGRRGGGRGRARRGRRAPAHHRRGWALGDVSNLLQSLSTCRTTRPGRSGTTCSGRPPRGDGRATTRWCRARCSSPRSPPSG